MAEPLQPAQIVNAAKDSTLRSYDTNLQDIPLLSANSNIYITEVNTNNIVRNTVNNYFLPDQVTANAFPALAVAPTQATVGSVYYDTVIHELLVWNGAAWTEIASSITAANVYFAPTASLFSSNVQAVIPELQALMVPIAGGTMTGPLILSGAPTSAMMAATKQYVDAQDQFAQDAPFTPGGNLISTTIRGAINELDLEKVSISGDTMTGFLTLNADPVQPLHAATKQYVDAMVTPTGVDTQVLFIDAGKPTGDPGFTFDKATSTLTVANAFNVVDIAASGNVVATGNVSGLNGAFTGNMAVTGNVTADNGTYSGNLAATGNVSGLNGTFLGNVAVTGNVSGLNFAGSGNGVFTGNVQANVGFIGNSLMTRDGPMMITSTGTNNIELAVGTGNINLVTQTNITNVKDPINPQDAATKFYVDALAAGLQIKDTCNAATSTTLAASSGGAISYNNGTSGVGATLTTTGSFAVIDGYSLVAGDRVLIKNEGTTSHNGIYTYVNSSTLMRATDSDAPAELDSGSFVFITDGSTNKGAGFVQTNNTLIVGTDPVLYNQFSSVTGYTAGTGLQLVGTQFQLQNTAVAAGSYGNATHSASFTVDAQGRLTAASASAITANAETLLGATLNSTVVNSSLTSVGTLTTLTVAGTTTAADINSSGNVIATGNVKGAKLESTGGLVVAGDGTIGNLVASGNVDAANFNGGNYYGIDLTLTGDSSVGGNAAVTGNASVGGNLAVTGNASATNFNGGNFYGNFKVALDTQVIFNDSGNLAGEAGLTYNKTTDALTGVGTITGGNLSTAGNLVVTGHGNIAVMTYNPASANGFVIFGAPAAGSFGSADRLIIDCGTF